MACPCSLGTQPESRCSTRTSRRVVVAGGTSYEKRYGYSLCSVFATDMLSVLEGRERRQLAYRGSGRYCTEVSHRKVRGSPGQLCRPYSHDRKQLHFYLFLPTSTTSTPNSSTLHAPTLMPQGRKKATTTTTTIVKTPMMSPPENADERQPSRKEGSRSASAFGMHSICRCRKIYGSVERIWLRRSGPGERRSYTSFFC